MAGEHIVCQPHVGWSIVSVALSLHKLEKHISIDNCPQQVAGLPFDVHPASTTVDMSPCEDHLTLLKEAKNHNKE
jgi:hypothetical protein